MSLSEADWKTAEIMLSHVERDIAGLKFTLANREYIEGGINACTRAITRLDITRTLLGGGDTGRTDTGG